MNYGFHLTLVMECPVVQFAEAEIDEDRIVEIEIKTKIEINLDLS